MRQYLVRLAWVGVFLSLISLPGCQAPSADSEMSEPAATEMAGSDSGLAYGEAVRGRFASAAERASSDLYDAEAPQEEAPQASGDPARKLIYDGTLRLAVADFEATADRARELAQELGGYLQSLTDDQLTLRIPAERWNEAIERFEQLGDVVGRRLEVRDVTEEFTDLEIQLANARALRQRLEELLARAEDVEAALKIEVELGRVRTEIERLEGRLRFLSNRVAFGTLMLQLVPVATAGRTGGLPFPWLRQLGVVDLLGLEGRER